MAGASTASLARWSLRSRQATPLAVVGGPTPPPPRSPRRLPPGSLPSRRPRRVTRSLALGAGSMPRRWSLVSPHPGRDGLQLAGFQQGGQKADPDRDQAEDLRPPDHHRPEHGRDAPGSVDRPAVVAVGIALAETRLAQLHRPAGAVGGTPPTCPARSGPRGRHRRGPAPGTPTSTRARCRSPGPPAGIPRPHRPRAAAERTASALRGPRPRRCPGTGSGRRHPAGG